MKWLTLRRIATALSLIGALLVSLPSDILRLLGFIMWIIANSYWLNDAVKRDDVEQQGLWAWFTLSAVIGAFWILWGWTHKI